MLKENPCILVYELCGKMPTFFTLTAVEENVPALSLQQCECITTNQWFTVEVRYYCKCMCIIPVRNVIRYTVKLMKDMCTCDLRCSTCRACIHTYTCSCIDSTLHATVCKHAHAIAMMTANSTSDVSTSASQVDYFTNILEDGQQKCTHKEALRQQLLNKISEITVLVRRCETLDANCIRPSNFSNCSN